MRGRSFRPKTYSGRRLHYRESPIQKSIVNFLQAALPENALFYAIPNEGRRSPQQAGLAKAMGLRAGMPDLGLVHEGRAFFLEVKDPKRGRLSKSQSETIPQLRAAGAGVAIVTSPEEVEHQLRAWGIPLKASIRLPGVSA